MRSEEMVVQWLLLALFTQAHWGSARPEWRPSGGEETSRPDVPYGGFRRKALKILWYRIRQKTTRMGHSHEIPDSENNRLIVYISLLCFSRGAVNIE
jgi:hypothetical protein